MTSPGQTKLNSEYHTPTVSMSCRPSIKRHFPAEVLFGKRSRRKSKCSGRELNVLAGKLPKQKVSPMRDRTADLPRDTDYVSCEADAIANFAIGLLAASDFVMTVSACPGAMCFVKFHLSCSRLPTPNEAAKPV